MDLPYKADPLDHAETPGVAYEHIVQLLDFVCMKLGKSRDSLIIYDPYYCKGAVIENLCKLGFTQVINKKQDFYTNPETEFDVVVTNPPYSGDHPEKLIDFCSKYGKPWFLLVPNWVYLKPYWQTTCQKMRQRYGSAPFFVAPKKRYIYHTPKGLRADSDDGKTSPFITFWFCFCQGWNKEAYSICEKDKIPGTLLARETKDLPMTYLDQFDPEYKRQRNIMKSQKRNNKFKSPIHGIAKPAWGHKSWTKMQHSKKP